MSLGKQVSSHGLVIVMVRCTKHERHLPHPFGHKLLVVSHFDVIFESTLEMWQSLRAIMVNTKVELKLQPMILVVSMCISLF